MAAFILLGSGETQEWAKQDDAKPVKDLDPVNVEELKPLKNV